MMKIGDLPKDCLIYLCGKFLTHEGVGTFAATCRSNKFVLDDNLVWRLKVENEFGVHWRESQLHMKIGDPIPRDLLDLAADSPGHFRRIYKHLYRFGNILTENPDTTLPVDTIVKILSIGDPSTGKTSLIRRFMQNEFIDQYISTIGVEFSVRHTKTVDSFEKKLLLKLQLWDTAGRERFRAITQSYYRGVHGFLVIFSLEDRESFHHIRNWFSEIERFTTPGSEKAIVLVGSKMDMTEQRKVSHQEARTLADEFGVPYFETSAKTGEGVDRAYFTLASMSLRKLLLNSDPTRTRPPPPSMAQPDTSKGWFASLFDRLFSSSGAGGGGK